MVDALTMQDRGAFEVLTDHSRYQVELRPDGSGRLLREPLDPRAESMRNDDDWIELLEILDCSVGDRAAFKVKHPQAPHNPPSLRVTTAVVSIGASHES